MLAELARPTAGILARLAVLADAQLPTPAPDRAGAGDEARRILSDGAYAEAEPSLWEKLLSWLGERFGRTVGDMVTAPGSNLVAWIVLAALLAGTGLLVWRAVRGTRRARPLDRGPELFVEELRSAHEWGREAEALEAAGRWREALRCRYRELVERLVELGVVQDLPGRTAGEYRVEVARALPDSSPAFTEATDLFERAWYGDQPTGEDESRRFRTLSTEVHA